MTFVETDHPRTSAGKFTDKEQTAAEVSLASPRATFNDISDRSERVKAMHDELLVATEALADDEAWQGYLNAMGKFHRYSFNNQMLIHIQRPDATRVASFKVWKELGRPLRKGERGISILAPLLVAEKDDHGVPKRDADGKVIKKYVGAMPTTVFDISQTEGDDLPTAEWDRPLQETPPDGYISDLTAAVEREGYTVVYEKSAGGAKGSTSRTERIVRINPDLTPGEEATTLAHELGHVMCGHMDEERLGDYHTGHGGRRGDMEMEAESFAYVLSRANGMETHLRGASEYVAGWGTRSKEDLKATGRTVQDAVKRALERPWVNVPV